MTPVSTDSSGYSLSEEFLNAVTHGIGLALAIVGLVYLILRADTPLEITSVSIYGGTLIFMFLASTVYHSIHHAPSKRVLKIVDHAAIYLLIAGTYTPFLLISLSGTISVVSIIVIWTIAAVGVGFKLFAANRFPRLSLMTYLGMGWFVLVIIYPLYQSLESGGLWLLFSGGILFSVGVVFYAAKNIRFTHSVWHLFVVGGCMCHFYSVYYFVV